MVFGHSFFLVLSDFINIGQRTMTLNISDVIQIQDMQLMIYSIFFLVVGLLVSGSWLLTSIAILLDTVAALLYFTLYLYAYDTFVVFLVSAIAIFICYMCYYYEAMRKKELIQMN